MSRHFAGGASTDVIDCGTTFPAFTTGTGVSMGAWIFWDAASGGNLGRIIEFGNGLGLFVFDNGGAGFVEIEFEILYATTPLNLVSSANTVINSVWVFVFATWDGTTTATNSHLYASTGGLLNEVTYTTQTSGVGAFTAPTHLLLGNNPTGTRCFGGRIGYAFYANRVMTVGEAQSIMHGEFSMVSTQGMFPLWGNSPEPDLSGNADNGTLTGTTVTSNPPVGFPALADVTTFVPAATFVEEEYWTSGVVPTLYDQTLIYALQPSQWGQWEDTWPLINLIEEDAWISFLTQDYPQVVWVW